MARIITKELALKIVKKLNAVPLRSRSKAHDLYEVQFNGVAVAVVSVRRGSKKDLGHDHIPRDLHLGPNDTKQLGRCPFSVEDYYRHLRGLGLLPEEADAGEAEQA